MINIPFTCIISETSHKAWLSWKELRCRRRHSVWPLGRFDAETSWLLDSGSEGGYARDVLSSSYEQSCSHRNWVYKQLTVRSLIHKMLFIECLSTMSQSWALVKTTNQINEQNSQINKDGLTEFNTVLPCNPATVLLDIYLADLKTYALHTNVYNSFIHGHQKREASMKSSNRWKGSRNRGGYYNDQWNTIRWQKGMNYQAIQKHGWVLHAYR